MPVSDKATLRRQLRRQLAGLDTGSVRAHSAAVWERLARMREFQAAQCIGAYVSVDREIETHGLIRQLLAVGRRVCVPAFVGEYVAAEIADFDADLQPGQFGILEPRTVRPAQPEVWLVPGLGFDRRGNRLGRGRGFFDALLRRTLALKIALAHEFQVLERIPAEAHDARMDRIVTETQVYECGGER